MPSNKGSKIPLPRCLYLEVTNRCNLRCRTCLQFRGIKEQYKDLSLKEVKEVAGQVPELKRAVLHGIGEPLLNEELVEIVKYLKRRKVHVLFNTNGLLLNKRLAERLVLSGLDELRFSLDGATQPTYARVRCADNFIKVVKNIQDLVEIRGSSHGSIPKVSLWMVATGENVQDLPEMIKLAARTGIDEVYLQRLVYPIDGPGRGLAVQGKTITNPSPAIGHILDVSASLSRELQVSLRASGRLPPKESLRLKPRDTAPWRQCRRPWEVAYITAWGNLLPCCISPFSTQDYASLILGNVFKESLEQVWGGEKYGSFREKHQSPEPPSCCAGCGVEWSL